MKRLFHRRQPWPVVAGIFLPTVLLGLVLLGLALYTARGSGREAIRAPGTGDTQETTGTGRAITTFAAFTSERSAGRAALPDRQYSATGVRHLADAIAAIAHDMEELSDPHAPAAADVDELRSVAVQLASSSSASDHAALVGRAFAITTTILTGLQRERFSALTDAVDAMRETGSEFVQGSMTDQRVVVERYFEQASDVLRAMWKMGL